MNDRRLIPLWVVALNASALLHGVAYASLGKAEHPSRQAPLTSVLVDVDEPAPKVATAAPEPTPIAPKPEPQLPRAPAIPPPSTAKAPTPESAPPTRAPETAVDLSGVTLSNDDGDASWSSPKGNGSAWSGPLPGVRGASLAGIRSNAPATSKPVLPELVALGDLSARPTPPALDAALRSHYPDEARRRAISGTASLRTRIDADGRVRGASILQESFAGFGDACRRAVLGSVWSPPRDRSGRAVATEVRYTCRFVVE